MRCSSVRRLLDDHVDGVLPGDRSDQLRRHLDSCADCDQEAELLRAATAPLSAWGDLAPPADCFDRILDRIDALPPEMHVPVGARPTPSLRFLRGGARWVVTSGAVAAAVLAAAILVDQGSAAGGDAGPRVRIADTLAGSLAGSLAGTAAGTLGGPLAGAVRLRPGEIPLTRTRFVITDDLEQTDGLRRERVRIADVPGLRAVPVSAEILGSSPR